MNAFSLLALSSATFDKFFKIKTFQIPAEKLSKKGGKKDILLKQYHLIHIQQQICHL